MASDSFQDAWPLAAWPLALLAMSALGGKPSTIARLAGFAIAASALALPWLLPARWPLLRAGLALATLWSLARYVELPSAALRSSSPPRSFARRLWHLVALVDTRRARPAAPVLETSQLLAAAAWSIAAASALALAALASRIPVDPWWSSTAAWAARWLAGLAFVYAMVEATAALLDALHALAGWQLPPLHVRPIAATSLADFWGQRWNRPVSAWLREHWFMPAARAGHGRAAMQGSFVWSGLLHAAFTLPAAGGRMAALMAAFFAAHGLGMLIERSLGKRKRLRGAVARAWTLAFLVCTSPLFVEPSLRIVLPGVPGGQHGP